jgi:uncharacterized membrane-anchored protein YhcB (DUF1043 family)
MEFFRSCYFWVAENYKEITMTFTTAQLFSLISGLVLLVKTIRKTKENTATSIKLKETLTTTNSMSDTVTQLKTELAVVKAENENLKNTIAENQKELVDFLNTHSTKINTMLEVQSIVYSTIKDDTIRKTVNSLLVNAKYAETASRVKLQEEVESLKAKVDEKMREVAEDVDKAATVVKNIVNPVVDDAQNLMRY